MIRIIEVSPRDGLQNESTPIATHQKVELIARLASAGLTEIEATSFVSPKAVPQLADSGELWPLLPSGPLYSALTPNAKGLQRAMEVGVERIAVFTAASEAFVQHNIRMTIEESLAGFRSMVSDFKQSVPNGFVRGYVSTIFECPYSGKVLPAAVAKVVESLLEMGCDEISLGDTIGVGSPSEVKTLFKELSPSLPINQMVWHFHDTRGTAVANVVQALELGCTSFDSSAAGLGGCPYAPGAGGNLATEDLVYLLEREGISTNINSLLLAQATLPVLELQGKPVTSKSQAALLSACK